MEMMSDETKKIYKRVVARIENFKLMARQAAARPAGRNNFGRANEEDHNLEIDPNHAIILANQANQSNAKSSHDIL
jgi:hypothetical protein